MVDAIGKAVPGRNQKSDLEEHQLSPQKAKVPSAGDPEAVIKTSARSRPAPEARGNAIRTLPEAESTARTTADALLAAGPAAVDLHQLQPERVQQLTADEHP